MLHATLLRSTPAANSHLEKSPQTIRLVFSERIVPELSRITLIGARGDSSQLELAADAQDPHVLIGTVVGELRGLYKISWRAVAADGHPSAGSFSFTVGPEGVNARTDTSAATRPGVIAASSSAAVSLLPMAPISIVEEKPVPVFASLFRGVGLGAMMAGIGILFFGVTAGERRFLIPGALVTSLIAVGALLLVAHLIMWLEHVSPTGHLTSAFLSSVFKSTVGQVELLRAVFAVLAVWAIALERHRKVALWLGVACLVISGAAGHPAAIHPFWAIPSKVVHLLFASVWLGGLLWLVWVARCLMFLAYTTVVAFMYYFLQDAVHYAQVFPGQTTAQGVNTFFAVNVVTIIIASLVGGIISDRLLRRKLFVIVASVIMAVGLLLFAVCVLCPVHCRRRR